MSLVFSYESNTETDTGYEVFSDETIDIFDTYKAENSNKIINHINPTKSHIFNPMFLREA